MQGGLSAPAARLPCPRAGAGLRADQVICHGEATPRACPPIDATRRRGPALAQGLRCGVEPGARRPRTYMEEAVAHPRSGGDFRRPDATRLGAPFRSRVRADLRVVLQSVSCLTSWANGLWVASRNETLSCLVASPALKNQIQRQVSPLQLTCALGSLAGTSLQIHPRLAVRINDRHLRQSHGKAERG
jgi:hypothetical protein